MKRVAIIGGGASGMIASITLARAGITVDVYEKNDRIGKKILASGNGRCNITNTHITPDDYFGNHPEFVTHALSQFGFSHFKKFCRSIGLLLNTKQDGKTYPLSDEARSVVTALESAAKSAGVNILCNAHVEALSKHKDAFSLTYNGSTSDIYDYVIIATGSEAAPQLGSTADGYDFARSLGHDVEPAYPALVALELKSPWPAKMGGVKQKAVVTLYIDGKAEQTCEGDILFTKYGVSGFAILDISEHASKALVHYHRVSIGINLMPDYNRQTLSSLLSQLAKELENYSVESVLSGIIPIKVAKVIMQLHNIPSDTQIKALSAKQFKQLGNTLIDWRFEVNDTHGFKHAEVSGGGVSTAQIHSRTMMSQVVKNLYFTGEVIDVVGRRGGYNLHFAWASGYMAAHDIAHA